MNEDKVKVKIIESIINGYYEYTNPTNDYTEAIIDSVFDVINTDISEGE